MRGIEIALVLATGLAMAGGGLLFVSQQEHTARMSALERELGVLRQKNETQEMDANARASQVKSRPVGELGAQTALAESDLADQVAALSTTVKKLEQTAEMLDSRIKRSRLAVPNDEERAAQIARGRARLEELRKTADDLREKAKQVATSLKVPFDEKRLLEPGANAALEEKAEFVQARDAAAAQARVVEIFEKNLAELQFSTVVEALPPQEQR